MQLKRPLAVRGLVGDYTWWGGPGLPRGACILVGSGQRMHIAKVWPGMHACARVGWDTIEGSAVLVAMNWCRRKEIAE